MSRDIAAGGFLAPVTERERHLGRLLILIGLGAGLAMALTVAAVIPLQLADPTLLARATAALEGSGFPDGRGRLLDESRLLLVLAVSLGAPALGILLAAAIAFGRPVASFLWPGRRFSLAHLAAGFVVMAALVTVAGAVGRSFGMEVRLPVFDPAYPAGDRALYALAAISLLLVAATAEEVVCRGVLLQVTGAFARQAWVLCVINGLVFSALHLDPDPVAFAGRALSGVVWAWAALRLGGLEFAIGAHWANNLLIALLGQPFSSAAQVDQGFGLESLLVDGAMSLGVLAAVELWARRRSAA